MSENAKLMNFDEFRAACDAPAGGVSLIEAARQQLDHFRDRATAEALLRPGAISVLAWVMWKDPDGMIGA